MTGNIVVDLYADWIALLRHDLTSFGYPPAALQSEEQVSHVFWNRQKRLVSAVPRKVLKAKEFTCPPELHAGLALIEDKLSRGIDVFPHLSTRIRNHDYDDPLLNDWSIHHLHLGTTMKANGFIARTGPLLFALFDREHAYLLGVLEHGVWSRQEFVRVLHRNWPSAIARHRMQGVLEVAYQATDEDIANLRDANVNTVIQVEPGVVYSSLGGGYATSGLSVEVVMRSDRCRRFFRESQKALIANIDRVKADAAQRHIALPEQLSFKLAVDNGHAYAIETTSNMAVLLGRFPF